MSIELADGEEFIRIARALEITGLSRRAFYREIEDGRIPRGRNYPGKRITFWLLSEIRQWQAEQLRLVEAA